MSFCRQIRATENTTLPCWSFYRTKKDNRKKFVRTKNCKNKMAATKYTYQQWRHTFCLWHWKLILNQTSDWGTNCSCLKDVCTAVWGLSMEVPHHRFWKKNQLNWCRGKLKAEPGLSMAEIHRRSWKDCN